ncbi:MAG: SIMPL domain-containing protein [Anaerolineales bacterium]
MKKSVGVSKRWGRGLLLVLLAVPLLLAGCDVPTTGAGVRADTDQRTISVVGVGQASAAPDRAVVVVGVETEAETAEAALSRNNAQMGDLIAALVEAGIPEEDIQTRTVNLRPRYQEVRPEDGAPSREVTGYVATNTVEVTIEVLEDLGELLDTAIRAGGNRIENVRFEISDPAQLLDDAREAAWTDAQEKAMQLVTLAGAELGPVQSINESTRTPRPVRGVEMEEAARAVPVQPGTENIEVELQITWLILPD